MTIKHGQCKKLLRILSHAVDPTRKVGDDETSHQPELNTDQERESHSRPSPYTRSLDSSPSAGASLRCWLRFGDLLAQLLNVLFKEGALAATVAEQPAHTLIQDVP
jgi:hypothetical protein